MTDIATKPTGDTPFLVYVQEGSHQLIEARFKFPHDARRYAERLWDDALPQNRVYVMDERTGKVFGYAGHAGDGSVQWYPST